MDNRALGAGLVLLLAGCASTPPPPPGPTMEEFRALSATAVSIAKEKAALEARVSVLEKNLEEVRKSGERTALEKDRLETECKRLCNELANLTSMLNSISKDSTSRPATVPDGDTPTSASGSVLAADAKMDIYLISVGRKDGVKIADEFTVFRDNQFVAQVVVDKVFEDKASVVVKKLNGKPMSKSEIRTGDRVASGL